MQKRKEVTFVRKAKTKSLVGYKRGAEDINGNRVDELEFENEISKESWVEKYFRTSDGLSILIGDDNVFN